MHLSQKTAEDYLPSYLWFLDQLSAKFQVIFKVASKQYQIHRYFHFLQVRLVRSKRFVF
jgi:hypothetical protein